jgi:hypothetical protein
VDSQEHGWRVRFLSGAGERLLQAEEGSLAGGNAEVVAHGAVKHGAVDGDLARLARRAGDDVAAEVLALESGEQPRPQQGQGLGVARTEGATPSPASGAGGILAIARLSSASAIPWGHSRGVSRCSS